MLTFAPLQLLLFPDAFWHNWHPSPTGRGLQDKRTARQWINSVVAYLHWRAGDPWRNLSEGSQRWNPERLEYLDAIRAVERAFHKIEEPAGLRVALPVLNPAPPPLPSELQLAELPRKTLVDALLCENPALSNRKLLMKLKSRKLAHMLAQVRLDAAAVAEPERRLA